MRSRLGAILGLLLLSGCVIDVGAPVQIVVGEIPHDTIELHVLEGACPAELVDASGGVTRAGAIELAEGFGRTRNVVARALLRSDEPSDPLPRLSAGLYCVTALARAAGCVTTGMAIMETSLYGASPMPVVLVLSPPPRTSDVEQLAFDSRDWSCGRRICSEDECVVPPATPERCGDRCTLCPALATDASFTASHGGYGACLAVETAESWRVVPSIPLRAAPRATPYEWSFLDVCAANCVISAVLARAIGGTDDAQAFGEACGGCCAAVGEAGLCGAHLTSYLACALPSAIASALEAGANEDARRAAAGEPSLVVDGVWCHFVVRSFMTMIRCAEGTACVACRERLETAYESLDVEIDLGSDDALQRLVTDSMCGPSPGATSP